MRVARTLERYRLDGGFEITDTKLELSSLHPAHHGMTVAQLSDVHVGLSTPERRVQAAVEMINRRAPDLVFLTGDYVNFDAVVLADVFRLLGGIEAPTFVILGNHDHWVAPTEIRRGFEAIGYAVLQNEHRVVPVRGAPVTVLGIDDRRTKNDDVKAAFMGAPTEGTRLVLAHNPLTADDLPASAGLVCFSGHTHGGQIILPGRATERVLARIGMPYIRGHYVVRGNQLYVNRGLGFGRNVRFMHDGSRPEVAFFRLTGLGSESTI